MLADADLCPLAQAGDGKAADVVIGRHRGMLQTVICRWYRRSRDKEDVDQVGLIGAVRAVQTFDSSKGVKFLTWCADCVRNHLRHVYRPPITVNGRYLVDHPEVSLQALMSRGICGFENVPDGGRSIEDVVVGKVYAEWLSERLCGNHTGNMLATARHLCGDDESTRGDSMGTKIAAELECTPSNVYRMRSILAQQLAVILSGEVV